MSEIKPKLTDTEPVFALGDCTDVTPVEFDPMERVFIPTWDNQPEFRPPLLSLAGVPLLSYQNLTALVAAPGSGKSSNCEAILASILNPDADCLGWSVDENVKSALFVDFERTNDDVWNSFYRMTKRANVRKGTNVSNIKIAGLRSVPQLSDRISTVENILKDFPCDLLLLDGAGDIVSDVNNSDQTKAASTWIRELTVKYKLSIFTTIHPNPAGDKPRGHLGSEICREAESALIIRKHDDDTRLITSAFDYGKTRNGPPVTAAYCWSDDKSMFVSTHVPVESSFPTSRKSHNKLAEASEFDDEVHFRALKAVFIEGAALPSGKFISGLMSAWGNVIKGDKMSDARAKNFRAYYIQMGFLKATGGMSIMEDGKVKNNVTINEIHEDYRSLVEQVSVG